MREPVGLRVSWLEWECGESSAGAGRQETALSISQDSQLVSKEESTHTSHGESPSVDLVRQLFQICGTIWIVQHTVPSVPSAFSAAAFGRIFATRSPQVPMLVFLEDCDGGEGLCRLCELVPASVVDRSSTGQNCTVVRSPTLSRRRFQAP